VQNEYAILEDNKDNDEDINDDVATVTTHLVGMTTQSQLTAASTAVNAAAVITAINHFAVNQTAMMQMMAYANTTRTNNQQRARAIAGMPPVQYTPAMVPPLVPITQYSIPNFHQGSQGRGGRRQGGGHRGEDAKVDVPSTIKEAVLAFPLSCLAPANLGMHETWPQHTPSS
jgi:hypothetical protein